IPKILLDIDQGQKPAIANYLIRIDESLDLYCLPAGKPTENYSRVLSLLDPSMWYREEQNPLRQFIDLLKNDLPFKPDVIVIDSRTGISPLSAPLLFDVSDIALVCFF